LNLLNVSSVICCKLANAKLKSSFLNPIFKFWASSFYRVRRYRRIVSNHRRITISKFVYNLPCTVVLWWTYPLLVISLGFSDYIELFFFFWCK
jgi:hypothetical protein